MPHSASESTPTMDLMKPTQPDAVVAPEKPPTLTDVAIFKKPMQPAPKARLKVLDEDNYIEQMEKIIQRDFFPDMEKVKAQFDYLNAVDNNDVQTLRELALKYS